MKPVMTSINAKYIVEVGSDSGINTENILKYCMENDARLTAIDPLPKFDIDKYKDKYGDKFEIYKDLSLSRLPLLKDYDVILIDGDHNWYTVYNELKIIEKTFKDKKFPVIFLHDVGWPYGRRDLYYNPENIPKYFQHPYKKLGIYPGKLELVDEGGLNNHLFNSVYANNPNNGVLAAVEDFIDESELEFYFDMTPAFYGLGILYPKMDKLKKTIESVIENSDLMAVLEKERAKLSIFNLEMAKKNSFIQANSKKIIDETIMKLQEEIKKTEQLEKDYIESKKINETIISEMEKREKKIIKDFNSQLDFLTKNYYEMQYSNNKDRSFSKRIFSKFPSTYILLNSRKTGIKNAFRNIKGYRAIKNNNLLDIGYYLKNNPDVRHSGMDPILQYMYHGYKEEKRRPNPNFDAKYYLQRYPDVKNSNLNPLVHYSLYGMGEGRKISNNEVNKNQDIKNQKQRYMEMHHYSNSQINNILDALDNKKISIIVPIYNAFEDTKKCIDSVLENTNIPYELILIDDNSTDGNISTLLDEMEEIPNIRVLRNKENLGFVKTINKGIKNSSGDVVLLNSDTVVTRRWLLKFVFAAYYHERIGTVNPLTNASVVSVPEMGKNNPIPRHLNVETMGSLIERSAYNMLIEAPTGNGFCIFIKRSTIENVGQFDEKFGRGYGEEDDFCMRAGYKNWMSVYDDSNFVYHHRNVSFSTEVKALKERNGPILSKDHPTYPKLINTFLASDILQIIADNVKNALRTTELDKLKMKRLLMVINEDDLDEELIQKTQNVFEYYILTLTSNKLNLATYENNKLQNMRSWDFNENNLRDIYINLLMALKIDTLFVPASIEYNLLNDIPNILGLPVIFEKESLISYATDD